MGYTGNRRNLRNRSRSRRRNHGALVVDRFSSSALRRERHDRKRGQGANDPGHGPTETVEMGELLSGWRWDIGNVEFERCQGALGAYWLGLVGPEEVLVFREKRVNSI